jgi:hypothetical protein
MGDIYLNGSLLSGGVKLNGTAMQDVYLNGTLLWSYDFSLTISSNQQQLNLATYASSNGWNGSAPLVITIASGVHITSSSPSTSAISTGSCPAGLTILNSGNIHGDGGNGGNAYGGYGPGSNGDAGGHAILVTNSTSLSVTNNSGGVIAGGGGGGGAGAGRVGGGMEAFGGGGGGGRCGNGHTTSAGTATSFGGLGTSYYGSSGSYSSAGGGGNNGASGGTWGAAGGTGQSLTWSGGSGGAGGSAVSGSYTLTANNGTMYG